MPANINVEQLKKATDILGFDPIKKEKGNNTALQEVFDQVKKERLEKSKEELKKTVEEVLTLFQQRQEIINNFNQQEKGIDKKLNNLLSRLSGIKDGQEIKETEEEENKEEVAV